MAFSFDSAFALLLLAATPMAWTMAGRARLSARLYLRFATVLMAALAAALVTRAPGLGPAVAMIAMSLAAAALALAACFPRRPPLWLSSIALCLALMAGLAGALTPWSVIALAYQAAACGAILAMVFSRSRDDPRAAILSGTGALSLFLGAMSLMDESLGAAALFFAAALMLLARASQRPIAHQRGQGRRVISGQRAGIGPFGIGQDLTEQLRHKS
jgi:hypothetical protein